MIDLKWLKSTQNLTGSPLSGEKLPFATNIGKRQITNLRMHFSSMLMHYLKKHKQMYIFRPSKNGLSQTESKGFVTCYLRWSGAACK